MDIDRTSRGARPRADGRRDFAIAQVFAARELSDRMWPLVRAFAMRLDGSDIRARFGAQPDLGDEPTLRRFFGLPADAEILWMEDARGGIVGIGHRVRLSPSEDELAVVIRSDLKRRGAGTRLLRALIGRARVDGLSRVSGFVLSQNHDMIRIAKKEGFAATVIEGLNVRIELALQVGRDRPLNDKGGFVDEV